MARSRQYLASSVLGTAAKHGNRFPVPVSSPPCCRTPCACRPALESVRCDGEITKRMVRETVSPGDDPGWRHPADAHGSRQHRPGRASTSPDAPRLADRRLES